MPFGLTNAPATFQGLMNDVFRPLLRRYVLVFFDDILVYSRSRAEHLGHLRSVLAILRQHRLRVKASKCTWAQPQVDYLGHIIAADGVRADPEKISAMLSWPLPTTPKQMRGFLGLTGYYRRFICGYGRIAAPLTAMLRKNNYIWTEAARKAFEELKSAMTQAPVLALPDFTKPFVVECDASGNGIGAVLMQGGRPIAFLSKALAERKKQWSTYEREMFAIVYAVTKWRPYLLGRRFEVRTDQKSLPFLLGQRIHTPAQQKWLAKLLGYDYTLVYKKGSENSAADALSRRTEAAELSALSGPAFPLLDRIREATRHDPDLQQLLDQVSRGVGDVDFAERDGLLLQRGRVRVPADADLRADVIRYFHEGVAAGHEGMHKTYRRILNSCTWPGLQRDTRTFVRGCDVCQRVKEEAAKPAGLLQPLPIPEQVWEDISMDFIEGLPTVQGKSVIMVVVDRLTKYAHFIPLGHPYTATSVAESFVREVVRLHGVPRTIVSDRDPVFTSRFWRDLARLQGTELKLSSAYHPQTDGQTERVNRCVEQYLRCYAGDHPRQWLKYLPWAEWAYNTSHHSAIGGTPFEAVYGRPPPALITYTPVRRSERTAADEELRDRDEHLRKLKLNLAKAQNRMRQVYNKKHQDRNFEVGDWVYVKLQPYRQATVQKRYNQKLSHKFFGPFQVLQRRGPVAYELDLPSDSRVHPVFHVSALRGRVGTGAVSTDVPAEPEGDTTLRPRRVLAKRRTRVQGRLQTQLLVEWDGDEGLDPTWESEEDLMQSYPDFIP